MTLSALRALAGLLGFLAMVALAVAGLAVAVFCIQGGDETFSPANLASLLGLDGLRDTIGSWFESLEDGGSTAIVAALCGAGAVLLGAAVVVGALAPRRERLLTVNQAEQGEIAIRSRAAASALSSLAERPREVVRARARVRPARRGIGGRARLRMTTLDGTDERPRAVQSRADLRHLAGRMSLHLSSRRRRTRRGGRVL